MPSCLPLNEIHPSSVLGVVLFRCKFLPTKGRLARKNFFVPFSFRVAGCGQEDRLSVQLGRTCQAHWHNPTSSTSPSICRLIWTNFCCRKLLSVVLLLAKNRRTDRASGASQLRPLQAEAAPCIWCRRYAHFQSQFPGRALPTASFPLRLDVY